MVPELHVLYLIPLCLSLFITFFPQRSMHGQFCTQLALLRFQQVVQTDAMETHAFGNLRNIQFFSERRMTQFDQFFIFRVVSAAGTFGLDLFKEEGLWKFCECFTIFVPCEPGFWPLFVWEIVEDFLSGLMRDVEDSASDDCFELCHGKWRS